MTVNSGIVFFGISEFEDICIGEAGSLNFSIKDRLDLLMPG